MLRLLPLHVILRRLWLLSFFFFFNVPATTDIYTLSLHVALPISRWFCRSPPMLSRNHNSNSNTTRHGKSFAAKARFAFRRSEEHTSELQSHSDLVCRLLLEKKKSRSPARSINPDCHRAVRRAQRR